MENRFYNPLANVKNSRFKAFYFALIARNIFSYHLPKSFRMVLLFQLG